MTKKGQTVLFLFCALSVGGILTLFSQADALRGGAERMRAMDVSSPESSIFRRLVPTSMESGASIQAAPEDEEAEDQRPDPPVRLRLR